MGSTGPIARKQILRGDKVDKVALFPPVVGSNALADAIRYATQGVTVHQGVQIDDVAAHDSGDDGRGVDAA